MLDADLVNSKNVKELIAAGDQQAFRQLFDFYSRPLIQFACTIVKTREAALDVVDEVFIRLWRQKEHILFVQNIKVYLYKSVKNASLNYLSRIAHLQLTESFDYIDIQLSEEQNPDQQMITAELFNKIHAAVNELPPRCKMIFKLVREDGLKYKEVAEILNLSVNTVDAQMVIAVKRISDKLKAHFDFFPKRVSKKV